MHTATLTTPRARQPHTPRDATVDRGHVLVWLPMAFFVTRVQPWDVTLAAIHATLTSLRPMQSVEVRMMEEPQPKLVLKHHWSTPFHTRNQQYRAVETALVALLRDQQEAFARMPLSAQADLAASLAQYESVPAFLR